MDNIIWESDGAANNFYNSNLILCKILYINLSIKLKNFAGIKEGVSNYKYMSQTANIQSLETVINYYKDCMEKIFKDSMDQYSEEDVKIHLNCY